MVLAPLVLGVMLGSNAIMKPPVYSTRSMSHGHRVLFRPEANAAARYREKEKSALLSDTSR